MRTNVHLVQHRLLGNLLFTVVNHRFNHHALAGRKVTGKQAIQSLRKAFHASLSQESHTTRVHAQNGRVVPERHMRRRKHRTVTANGQEQVRFAKRIFLDHLDGLMRQILQVIQNAEGDLRMLYRPLGNHVKRKRQIRILVFPAHDANSLEIHFSILLHLRFPPALLKPVPAADSTFAVRPGKWLRPVRN